MKKHIFMILLMILLIGFSVTALSGNSHDDYKVIKKAENSQVDTDEVTLFKILVTDSVSNKVKFRLTLPICLLDMISECQDDFKIKKNHCSIDLKKILNVLKKKGSRYLIEAVDDGETVKIWFE
jgi:hypothetical protein